MCWDIGLGESRRDAPGGRATLRSHSGQRRVGHEERDQVGDLNLPRVPVLIYCLGGRQQTILDPTLDRIDM